MARTTGQSPTETGSQTLYNQFGIEIAETPDGKVADVIVIPSYYSNAIQLYAISYTEKDAPTQGGDEGDGTEANPYTIDQILAMVRSTTCRGSRAIS